MSTTKNTISNNTIVEDLEKANTDLDRILGMVADDPEKGWLVNELMYSMEHLYNSIQKIKAEANI